MSTNFRPIIGDDAIELAVDALRAHLREVVKRKGSGSFASWHELMGVLIEEVDEAKAALHANDVDGLFVELLDVAQVCVFGLACFMEDTIG